MPRLLSTLLLVAGVTQTLAGTTAASDTTFRHEASRCNAAFFQSVLPKGSSLEEVAFVPQGGSFGEGASNLGYPYNPVNLPALCAVIVKVVSSPESSYRFGLMLPVQWNHRFLALGNGGFAGGINWLSAVSSALLHDIVESKSDCSYCHDRDLAHTTALPPCQLTLAITQQVVT